MLLLEGKSGQTVQALVRSGELQRRSGTVNWQAIGRAQEMHHENQ